MPNSYYQNIDFALLRVLLALLEERSVSVAAARLGISQPAASRALSKLRKHFDDQLLLRRAGGMVLTARAEQMIGPLRLWLADGAALFQPAMQQPETLNRTFRIASTDYGILSVVAPALAELSKRAPGINLDIKPLSPNATGQLRDGAIDLVITGFRPDPTQVHSRALFTEGFACLARENHPLLDGRAITNEAFHDWPQILFSVLDREALPALIQPPEGKTRRILVWTQSASVMAALVADNDAIAVLPRRAAEWFGKAPGLVRFDPPVPLGEFGYWLVWHERNHRDPAITWLVDLLGNAMTTPPITRDPAGGCAT